ncbi:MAG TPA: hypothetical protein VF519_18160 [Mycobacteriales bacterium]|jgi:hypothetical protein
MTYGPGVVRTRALVAAAVATAALLPGAAGAVTPGSVMSGTVTVSGRGAGYVPVTLPRAVDFRADGGRELMRPTVRLTGGAYGWLLVTTVGDRGGYAGAVRMPAAQGGTAVFRLDGSDPRTGQSLFLTSTLRAGGYRLYLLSNGPGTATLRLPGLRGASRTAVTRSARPATTTSLAPVVNGASAPAFASGVTFDSDVPALVLSFDWLYTATQAAAQFGSCRYAGAPPGGQWAPGCPGADVAMSNAVGVFTGCCGVGTASWLFAPGRWSFGHFYDVAGVVQRGGDFYVVLPVG